MIDIDPVAGRLLLGQVEITSRADFDKIFSTMSYAAELLWPTPDEPVRRKNGASGWTEERRQQAADRLKERRAAGLMARKKRD